MKYNTANKKKSCKNTKEENTKEEKKSQEKEEEDIIACSYRHTCNNNTHMQQNLVRNLNVYGMWAFLDSCIF
jgi:hypothetical protein